jgi:hypothetical protein
MDADVAVKSDVGMSRAGSRATQKYLARAAITAAGTANATVEAAATGEAMSLSIRKWAAQSSKATPTASGHVRLPVSLRLFTADPDTEDRSYSVSG